MSSVRVGPGSSSVSRCHPGVRCPPVVVDIVVGWAMSTWPSIPVCRNMRREQEEAGVTRSGTRGFVRMPNALGRWVA